MTTITPKNAKMSADWNQSIQNGGTSTITISNSAWHIWPWPSTQPPKPSHRWPTSDAARSSSQIRSNRCWRALISSWAKTWAPASWYKMTQILPTNLLFSEVKRLTLSLMTRTEDQTTRPSGSRNWELGSVPAIPSSLRICTPTTPSMGASMSIATKVVSSVTTSVVSRMMSSRISKQVTSSARVIWKLSASMRMGSRLHLMTRASSATQLQRTKRNWATTSSR